MKSKNILLIISIITVVVLSGCGASVPAAEQGEASGVRNKTGVIQDEAAGIQEESSAILEASEIRSVSFRSEALDCDMRLNIYLPKGYGGRDKYPVLYMIHGYTGNQDAWIPWLKLDEKADELIEAGRIKPLIIVCPQIDNSYGINSSPKTRQLGYSASNSLNEGMYEDYLYKDVVSYVDSNFSTVTDREGRYIGGMSMGGCTALHLAFAHPDMFSRAGGHSPALFINEFPNSLEMWLYPNESLRRERDPIYLAQDKDLSSMKVYLDCGDEDSYKFYEGCEKLYGILKEKGVSSEYHLNSGAHDGAYWQDNSENYLLFYSSKES